MKKLILTNKELEAIKDYGMRSFKEGGNSAIDSSLFPTACTVMAFVSYMDREHKGWRNMEIVVEKRHFPEPED